MVRRNSYLLSSRQRAAHFADCRVAACCSRWKTRTFVGKRVFSLENECFCWKTSVFVSMALLLWCMGLLLDRISPWYRLWRVSKLDPDTKKCTFFLDAQIDNFRCVICPFALNGTLTSLARALVLKKCLFLVRSVYYRHWISLRLISGDIYIYSQQPAIDPCPIIPPIILQDAELISTQQKIAQQEGGVTYMFLFFIV